MAIAIDRARPYSPALRTNTLEDRAASRDAATTPTVVARGSASPERQHTARMLAAGLDRMASRNLQAPTSPTLSANPSVDEAAAYLRATPQAATLDEMTHDQLRAYNVVLQEVGTAAVPHHQAWHEDDRNGPGGTTGEGLGERFLGMHRAMLDEVERRVDPSGNWRAPTWDPTKPIPAEITAEGVNRPDDLAPIDRPGWLRAEGSDDAGLAEGNARFGETATVDGQTFDSLDDFENPDQLGRALGQGYHASAHREIGGVMGGFASPSDPIFYGWHGHIDGVLDEWLATDNGQKWQAENPGHPLLDRHTPMETYDLEDHEDHSGH